MGRKLPIVLSSPPELKSGFPREPLELGLDPGCGSALPPEDGLWVEFVNELLVCLPVADVDEVL